MGDYAQLLQQTGCVVEALKQKLIADYQQNSAAFNGDADKPGYWNNVSKYERDFHPKDAVKLVWTQE